MTPIILTIYNRPEHTKRTLEALKANTLAKDSILYIYADGYKEEEDKEEVLNTREVVKDVKGFKEVHVVERDKNIGLANSIIGSVTEVINKHGKVILLEDDLVTSPVFLEYMNNMLDRYEKEKKVFSITGFGYPDNLMKIPSDYNYDVYFVPRAGSWGWATWKDRWNKADWVIEDFEEFKKDKKMRKEFNKGGDDMSDMLIRQMEGKIDSWAIRWCYTLFKNNAYCIYPIKSYVDNIGMDGSGVHCTEIESFENTYLNQGVNIKTPPEININELILKNFRSVFQRNLINDTVSYIKKKYKQLLK